MKWLWFEEPGAGSPEHNMAVDTALFEAVRDGRLSTPVLRVYRWDRLSVSIGRLQDAASASAVYPGLPLVRRPTGGRAVLHGADLTLSVITRDEWLPALDTHGVLSSYTLIVSGIAEALHCAGFTPAFGTKRQRIAPNRSPRCFDLVSACDVADSQTGRKLLGSAQRRERGAILQQMDIPETPEMDISKFLSDVRCCFGATLGVSAWMSVDTVPSLCYTI